MDSFALPAGISKINETEVPDIYPRLKHDLKIKTGEGNVNRLKSNGRTNQKKSNNRLCMQAKSMHLPEHIMLFGLIYIVGTIGIKRTINRINFALIKTEYCPSNLF